MNPKQSFFQRLLGVKVAEAPTTQLPDPVKIREAIAYNETGGLKGDTYLTSQPSGSKALGKAMGKYRVTEGELKTYAPKYMGREMTSKEFQTSKSAQDQYMESKINYYTKQGYTPEQIADIHRAGIKNSASPGSNKYQSPGYVAGFNKNYQLK